MPDGSPLRTPLRAWHLLALVSVLVLGTLVKPEAANAVVDDPPAHPTLTTVSCTSQVQFGAAARCTATVEDLTPSEIAVTPRGQVLFSSNRPGTFSGTCTLTTLRTGAARCSIDYTPNVPGAHQITGAFPGLGSTGGQPPLDPSEGVSGVEAIIADLTTTAVSCVPSVLSPGGSTFCKATVTDLAAISAASAPVSVFFTTNGPGTFSPTSCNVAFKGGGNNESVSCQVTYTSPQLSGLPHKITASFAGGLRHAASQGTTEVLEAETTATEVVCAPRALVLGEVSTCTATVTDTSALPVAPGGEVEFASDGPGGFRSLTPSCTLIPVGGVQAACQLIYVPSAVGSGHHRIEAVYQGNSDHQPSEDETVIDVIVEAPERERTGTTVVCDPGAVAVGSETLCTVTVAAATTPTGVVEFTTNGPGGFDDNQPSCTLQPSDEFDGEASCSVGYVPSGAGAGSHRIGASYQGDAGHRPSSGSTLLLVAGSIRYAAPQGIGVDPCNDPDDPCTLFVAADSNAPGTTIKAGDLVLMEPGEYSDSAGDLGPSRHQIVLKAGARLQGAPGEPRPVITTEPPATLFATPGLTVSAGSTVSHLRLESATAAVLIEIQGGIVQDVIAHSAAADSAPSALHPVVVCTQTGGLVRDSVCLASGAGAAAFGSGLGTLAPGTASTEVRNVTARSTGSGGVGVEVVVPAGNSFDVHGLSVIASGERADVVAAAQGTGAKANLEFEHSDYATVEEPNNGGVVDVTPAGSGTNITAEPLLAADGFHQLGNSPTVDAGFVDGLSGARDIDGQRRTLGSAPDIGADEQSAPSVTDLACDPRDLELKQTSTCTVTVEDTSLVPSTPTGLVRFSVDGGEGQFRETCALAPSGLGKARCVLHYTPTVVASGTHELTARYESDLDLSPSQDTEELNVTEEGGGGGGDETATRTTFDCAPATIETGRSVQCTASVRNLNEPAATAPTGEVKLDTNSGGAFSVDSCQLGAPVNGVASCAPVNYTPATVDSGVHTLEAAYQGDADHTTSTGFFELNVTEEGGGGGENGEKNPTTTTLDCRPTDVTLGGASVCTVFVEDTGADRTAPTGTVELESDSGTFTNICTLAPRGQDRARCQTVYDPADPGDHEVLAVYEGDDDHLDSEDSNEIAVGDRNGGHETATALECEPSPVILGGASVCTVNVSDLDDAPTVPGGGVIFASDSDGDFSSGGCLLFAVAPGEARCQLIYEPTEVGSGPHEIIAIYTGNPGHEPSRNTDLIRVDPPNGGLETTTALECDPDPVNVDAATNCTVTVANVNGAPNRPTRAVIFATDGAGTFNRGGCVLAGAGATASCQITYRPTERRTGTHVLTAVYEGDQTHEPSQGQTEVTVTEVNVGPPARETTSSVACAPASVLVNNAANCTATVSVPGANPGVPTGTVNFASDGQGAFSNSGGCTLNGAPGKASCQVTYTPLAPGAAASHKITASYQGDATHLPSQGSVQLGITGAATGPPNTILRKKPRKKTAKRKAVFRFVSDQPGSTFQCKLDKKPFKPCRSPWKKKVKPGRHTFRVRAINAQGVADPTPAIFKWKVGKVAKSKKRKG